MICGIKERLTYLFSKPTAVENFNGPNYMVVNVLEPPEQLNAFMNSGNPKVIITRTRIGNRDGHDDKPVSETITR